MPRQKITKPTNIYWLYDTRPETVAVFGPDGQPFYCGKTVMRIERRLTSHRCDAPKNPTNRTSAKILECGEYVRTDLIEVVPFDQDWVARERHWINEVRRVNPNATNTSAGGEGPAGLIHTAESRAKMSASRRGKKMSPEAVKNSANARRGQKRSPETCAKIGASHRGRKQSDETRAKRRASHLGKKHTPERCARISASQKGKKLSAEHCAKIAAAASLRLIEKPRVRRDGRFVSFAEAVNAA